MNNEKIGNFIRFLRKEANLTQKELADKLGITDRAVSKWERGRGCPDISLIEDVAKILGVSVLELLKGERLEKKDLKEQDLIETMNYTKKLTINKLKKYFNIFSIVVVVFFCLIIIFENIWKMNFVLKKHDMDSYYSDNSDAIEKLEDRYDLILSKQGIYNDYDYATITSYIEIMKKRLEEQNNKNYLKMENYNYFKILSFYIDHQNFFTIEIDNMDLYKIILEYDTSVSDNMVTYKLKHDNLNKELSNTLFYLQQPYFNYNILEFEGYRPNIYGIIKDIYENELMLANDIIMAGELYEK